MEPGAPQRSARLLISLSANGLLLLVIAGLWSRPSSPLPDNTREGPGTPGATATTTPRNHPGGDRPPSDGGPPVTDSAPAPAAPRFHWGSVESVDYREYIANLRAIGCPELTIRDIVLADLKRNADDQKRALKGPALVFSYWRTADKEPGFHYDQKELEEARAEIDERFRLAARELLGVDWNGDSPEPKTPKWDFDSQLAFLSPERREQVRAIRERYEEVEDQFRKMSVSRNNKPEDAAAVLAEYAAMKDELRAILSPREFELYEMSSTWTGDNLRNAMVGFNPTEDEYRRLFRIWRERDEALPAIYFAGAEDPGRESVFEAIREELGEERYQEYRRSWWNRDFHELVRIQQSLNLPDSTAAWVYDVKQIAEEQAGVLRQNSQWTVEQRNAALEALSTETLMTLSNSLGAAGMERYRRTQGRWLGQLVANR